MIKHRNWPSQLWTQPKKMFSGLSYKNGNLVNLLYWHVNPYVHESLCSNEWQGPNELFVKYVINSEWWEWSKTVDLEIWMAMEYLALDDVYVYTAYTKMLPKDETYFRLKYEVLHLKDIVF